MLEDSFLLPGVFRMPGTLTGAERLSAAIWKQRNVNKTWRETTKTSGTRGPGGQNRHKMVISPLSVRPECTAVL